MSADGTGRVWQRMLSGRRLDLADPAPVDVEIEDIAHGLARVARWNGQTDGAHAYSVAQHSLLVTAILQARLPTAGTDLLQACLLHDAPEYVIGDLISPFKAVVGDEYKQIESRLLGAIHLRFGLPAQISTTWNRHIKRADRIAAYHEATRLAGFGAREAARYFGRANAVELADWLLVPMAPRRAQKRFLDVFREIERARQTGTGQVRRIIEAFR